MIEEENKSCFIKQTAIAPTKYQHVQNVAYRCIPSARSCRAHASNCACHGTELGIAHGAQTGHISVVLD